MKASRFLYSNVNLFYVYLAIYENLLLLNYQSVLLRLLQPRVIETEPREEMISKDDLVDTEHVTKGSRYYRPIVKRAADTVLRRLK